MSPAMSKLSHNNLDKVDFLISANCCSVKRAAELSFSYLSQKVLSWSPCSRSVTRPRRRLGVSVGGPKMGLVTDGGLTSVVKFYFFTFRNNNISKKKNSSILLSA